MRKIVFWLHLVAGLVAGSIVLVMSVTGVLLAFERQITEQAEQRFRASPPSPGAAHLSAEVLLARVHEARPEVIPTGLTLRADSAAPATISLGREAMLFVNPYDGRLLGEGAGQLRAFFHAVTDWHRWLAREGEGRAVGKAITGACNLAFLFLVVSGFYLWFPRTWTRRSLAAVTVPSWQLQGKARDFNWHNALGFWSAPALFLIVLSGVFMSYPWATNLLYTLTGSEAPPAQRAGEPRREGGGPRREGAGKGSQNDSAPLAWKGLDALWSRAEQQVPGWQAISVRFAPNPNGPMAFAIERGPRGRPDLRATLTLDPKTGAVLKWEPFSSLNTGRQLRTWMRWIHTGEAGGLLGQIVAALVSGSAAVLVWTGFALSWRRFRRRNRETAASS